MKKYYDIKGNECTLNKLVKDEPEWAVCRIKVGEDAAHVLELIKAWDLNNYAENSKFSIPQDLRIKIKKVLHKY